MDYEADRPTWDRAGAWDRAVRLSRARTALGHPRSVKVALVDGAYLAIDESDTTRRHPL